MRFPTLGGQPNFVAQLVENAETVAIPKGAPVIYVMDGTRDALRVQLPSSSTDAKRGTFFAGVATKEIAASRIGEVLQYGQYSEAIIVRQTRAASTDSYASVASAAIGAILAPVVANGLTVAGASLGTNASAFFPGAALLQTLASAASSASATSNSKTAETVAAKVFLRIL